MSHSPVPKLESTSNPPAPRLAAVPGQEPRWSEAWVQVLLVALSFLPRVGVYLFNQNLYGDAVIRTELAQRWLTAPHVITSFADGAFQFGPLHLYLVAGLLKVGIPKEEAARILSLLFGTLSALPLYRLTRRLFDRRAAVVAVLGFAVWGMHLQLSSTGGSEALSLFLLLALTSSFARGLDEGRFAPIALAGVLLGLDCAVRYDFWLFIPLFCVLLFVQDKDKVAASTRAIFFGLICLPFPLAWMHGNEVALGDGLYPVHYIEKFHQVWVQDGIARWGNLGYRLQNLFFWPGMALFTLSPLIGLFGMVGAYQVYRKHREYRWLVWLVLAPTLYFTLRSALLMSFVPLGRFTVNQVALLLPFVAFGFDAWRAGKGVKRGVVALGAVLALALPVTLGVLTYNREGRPASSLRPVSPLSTNPPVVMEVARALHANAKNGGSLIVDADAGYQDLQLAFFSGFPEARMARYRWFAFPEPTSKDHPDDIARVRQLPPVYLVRTEDGELDRRHELTPIADGVRLRGDDYRELPGYPRPFHVYVRR